MNTNAQNEAPNVRPRTKEGPRGCAIPGRINDSMFGGWGPKLMGLALGAVMAGGLPSKSFAAAANAPHTTCTSTTRLPVLADTQRPGWPENWFDAAATGTVVLDIELDALANVRSVSVEHSSGDFELDQAARRVGSSARFSVPDGACISSPSTYRFIVESMP